MLLVMTRRGCFDVKVPRIVSACISELKSQKFEIGSQVAGTRHHSTMLERQGTRIAGCRDAGNSPGPRGGDPRTRVKRTERRTIKGEGIGLVSGGRVKSRRGSGPGKYIELTREKDFDEMGRPAKESLVLYTRGWCKMSLKRA